MPEEGYLDALRADLEAALPDIWGRKVHTVFIGGGSPSLLSAAGLDRLLSDLRALLPLEPDAEITMEANPGTVESDRFKSYRESGVNRLSIGIQSFDSEKLKRLGRVHNAEEARRAVEIAHQHFDNFNLDLMYALPSQTLAEARRDLETAIACQPPHLSLYHLTMEPDTAFAKAPPALPDEETSADMQDMIASLTRAAGYQHYEVSAYAQAGRQACHNLNYWRFGDYLGIGAGAHSKISFPDRIVREARHRQPARYMQHALQKQAVHERHDVGRKALGFEFMLNALRLSEGFPVYLFSERTGIALTEIEKPLTEAQAKGLIDRDHAWIRPTELGWRFLSDLQAMFLIE